MGTYNDLTDQQKLKLDEAVKKNETKKDRKKFTTNPSRHISNMIEQKNLEVAYNKLLNGQQLTRTDSITIAKNTNPVPTGFEHLKDVSPTSHLSPKEKRYNEMVNLIKSGQATSTDSLHLMNNEAYPWQRDPLNFKNTPLGSTHKNNPEYKQKLKDEKDEIKKINKQKEFDSKSEKFKTYIGELEGKSSTYKQEIDGFKNSIEELEIQFPGIDLYEVTQSSGKFNLKFKGIKASEFFQLSWVKELPQSRQMELWKLLQSQAPKIKKIILDSQTSIINYNDTNEELNTQKKKYDRHQKGL